MEGIKKKGAGQRLLKIQYSLRGNSRERLDRN